LPIADCTKSR